MNKNVDVMKNIRYEQLTRVFRSLIFVGFFILIASLSRILYTGWHNLMFVHIGSYLAIIVIEVFKNRISCLLKTPHRNKIHTRV